MHVRVLSAPETGGKSPLENNHILKDTEDNCRSFHISQSLENWQGMLPISEMPVWILIEGVTLLVSYHLCPAFLQHVY